MVEHNTTQHQHNTTQYSTIQHNTWRCVGSQHSTGQHCTTQHKTIHTAQHSTMQHRTIHHFPIRMGVASNLLSPIGCTSRSSGIQARYHALISLNLPSVRDIVNFQRKVGSSCELLLQPAMHLTVEPELSTQLCLRLAKSGL